MITINIVCVGTIKEKFWREAIDEYKKRISAFAKLNIVEVKEGDYGVREQDVLIAKASEAKRLQQHTKGYSVALEIDGKAYDSQNFARHLQDLMNAGNSAITFVIGGSCGIDSAFSKSLNEQLSFSSFTFPHQLMRVVLLEQIYRAFTILNGKTYHK